MIQPVAIRVSGGDLQDFIARVFRKSGFAAADAEAILMPGERSANREVERRRHGIPLARGSWTKMAAMAQDAGVALPPAVN